MKLNTATIETLSTLTSVSLWKNDALSRLYFNSLADWLDLDIGEKTYMGINQSNNFLRKKTAQLYNSEFYYDLNSNEFITSLETEERNYLITDILNRFQGETDSDTTTTEAMSNEEIVIDIYGTDSEQCRLFSIEVFEPTHYDPNTNTLWEKHRWGWKDDQGVFGDEPELLVAISEYKKKPIEEAVEAEITTIFTDHFSPETPEEFDEVSDRVSEAMTEPPTHRINGDLVIELHWEKETPVFNEDGLLVDCHTDWLPAYYTPLDYVLESGPGWFEDNGEICNENGYAACDSLIELEPIRR